MLSRSAVVLTTLLAGLVGLLASAPAQAAPALTLGHGARHPSARVVVTATGFPAGASTSIALDGSPLTSTSADASGQVVANVTVPAATLPGRHDVSATAGSVSAHASLLVRTDWAQPAFDGTLSNANRFENLLGASNADDLRPLWERFVSDEDVPSSLLIASGRLYVGYDFQSSSRRLVAYNVATGRPKFRQDQVPGAPLAVTESSIMMRIGNTLQVRSASSGDITWTTAPISDDFASGLLPAAGHRIWVGDNRWVDVRGCGAAVCPVKGSFVRGSQSGGVWLAATGAREYVLGARPAGTTVGRGIYVRRTGAACTDLVCPLISAGATDDPNAIRTFAIADDALLAFPASNVLAFDKITGAARWNGCATGGVLDDAVSGTTLVVRRQDQALVACDTRDGHVLWTSRATDEVTTILGDVTIAHGLVWTIGRSDAYGRSLVAYPLTCAGAVPCSNAPVAVHRLPASSNGDSTVGPIVADGRVALASNRHVYLYALGGS